MVTRKRTAGVERESPSSSSEALGRAASSPGPEPSTRDPDQSSGEQAPAASSPPIRRSAHPLPRAVSALRETVVSLLKGVWQWIPLAGPTRFFVKSLIFRHAAPLLRGTAAYDAWLEQWKWSGEGNRVLATGPSPYPPVPVVEDLRIPGGIAPSPRVSVIIPVYDKLDYTLACLDSIARWMPAAAIEVLVVDDGSTDGTPGSLSARDDIRYLRNSENLGFVGSCNRGAREARGTFLFFLNNDTIVLDGWLDALVATFDGLPDAGLVGSKLIYPDGRLQEAGGIVWEDGSAWNWGRLGDPRSPRYNFLRDVDYCSGAAAMIRRDRFLELGGFDERFAPAYYEDTDLAFALRERGLRVLYQPRSQIVHYEGVTCGTTLNQGIKLYQTRNRDLFRAKWEGVLSGHGGAARRFPIAADRRPRARMLIIDACTPTPDQDSGSVDMVNYLRILIDLGYRITFIPESNLLHYGRYTDALQAMGVECIYHPYIRSVKSFLSDRGGELDAVMLVRGPTAFSHIDAVRANCPNAKIIFNTVDLHYLRERRRAELETGRPESAEARRHRQMELHVIDRADATIVISPVERDLLEVEAPGAQVHVIPLLREIPGRGPGFRQRAGIVFVGGFRHPPNVDAVIWFCREIWPLIRARLPELELSIVGSHMVPEVDALAGQGIRVLGFVEDLDPIFGAARLSVAPLRYGAGQKGKVVTSLGYGVPCVLTTVAAEGLGLAEHEGTVRADGPAEIAAAVVELYGDPERWERLSDGGLASVEREFSVASNRSRIGDLLRGLGLPA